MKPTGKQVAALARSEALAGTIRYEEMDCQSFVEHVVNACGGSMDYRGSNDMFRNACTWTGTVSQALRAGKLVPGALLFIREEDGAPAAYDDGLGNFSHVGVYCGYEDCETADSGKSRGGVGIRAMTDHVWTHAGLAKAIEYGQSGQEETKAQIATVCAASGSTVNLRRSASETAVVYEYVPVGSAVEVLETGENWCRVRHEKTGWMQTRFLAFEEKEPPAFSFGEIELPRAEAERLFWELCAYLLGREEHDGL